MKKERVFGSATVTLGILLILTPLMVFPVCGMGRHVPPSGERIGHHGCHDTLGAEIALGAALIITGLAPIIWPRRKALRFSSIAMMVIATLVVVFPIKMFEICKMPTMPCRVETLPALCVIAILMGVLSGVGLFLSRDME